MDEILYNYLLVKNNKLATYGYTSDGMPHEFVLAK